MYINNFSFKSVEWEPFADIISEEERN
jgi:hypothetical protein